MCCKKLTCAHAVHRMSHHQTGMLPDNQGDRPQLFTDRSPTYAERNVSLLMIDLAMFLKQFSQRC